MDSFSTQKAFLWLRRAALAAVILWLLPAQTTAQWRQMQRMPKPVYGACAVTLGDSIYVIGGRTDEEVLNTVQRFNPRRNSWDTSVEELRQARANAAAVAFGGKIYVFGGENDEKSPLKSIECYDPKENRWRHAGNLLIPRSSAAAVVYQGLILVIGGSDSSGNYLSNVEVYNTVRAEISQAPQFLLPVNRTSAEAAVYRDAIFLFGGLFYGPIARIDRFTPDTGWQTVALLRHPRADFALAQADNYLAIIGGFGFSGLESTIEIWRIDRLYNLQPENEFFWPSPKAGVAAASLKDIVYLFGGKDPLRDQVSAEVQAFPIKFGVTDVVALNSGLPLSPLLARAFPNPARKSTTFVIRVLPQAENTRVARISIFDLRGRLVQKVTAPLSGTQTLVRWDGLDSSGRAVPAGLYTYTVQVDSRRTGGKLVILR